MNLKAFGDFSFDFKCAQNGLSTTIATTHNLSASAIELKIYSINMGGSGEESSEELVIRTALFNIDSNGVQYAYPIVHRAVKCQSHFDYAIIFKFE